MAQGKGRKRYPSGSMEHANWQQFKGYISGRIADSLEPTREHAAAVEEAKQNRFAAELWKAHAEDEMARRMPEELATWLHSYLTAELTVQRDPQTREHIHYTLGWLEGQSK